MKRAFGAVAVVGVACVGVKVVHELKNRERLIDSVEVQSDNTHPVDEDSVSETEEDEFSCPECDRVFDTEHGRNVHKGIVHKEDEEETEDGS